MKTVYDFYSLNSAVRADETEIKVEGKALEDMTAFLAKSEKELNVLFKPLKGWVTGGALTGGAVLLSAITAGVAIPAILLGAGMFKIGKSIVYDPFKGHSEDKAVKKVHDEIRKRYSSINVDEMFSLISKKYVVSKKDNTFVQIKHK